MSGVRFAPSRFAPSPGTIADQLRQRLLALDYPSFARSVCALLEALGYEEARPAGRQEWKGYNRPGGGGYDLEAVLPGGLAPRRVVVQIKQYDVPNVHLRNVDELHGACLRCGAAEAILVTTSSFSKVVQSSRSAKSDAVSAGANNDLIAPVRLIDGKELLGLMIRYRLGVRERNEGRTRQLAIDEAFFGAIAAENAVVSKGNASSSTSATTLREHAPLKEPTPLKSSVPLRMPLTRVHLTRVHLTIHISARPSGRQAEDGFAEGGR